MAEYRVIPSNVMLHIMTTALHFAERVDRCTTANEVIVALDKAVRPTIRAFGVWAVPLTTQRGGRDPFAITIHPDMANYMRDFWPKFSANGPSVLARRAWRTHRDFSLRDVLRADKPKPEDLWIFELLKQHGIADIRYIAIFRWWYGVFWSPKRALCLSKEELRALRIAAEAAAERIEEIVGRENLDPGLTEREREVLRLLWADNTELQVARRLKITLASVKQYVNRAKQKLGTHGLRNTIAEAVRFYVMLGIYLGLGSTGIYEIYDVCLWDYEALFST